MLFLNKSGLSIRQQIQSVKKRLDSSIFNRKPQLIKEDDCYTFIVFPQLDSYIFPFTLAVFSIGFGGVIISLLILAISCSFIYLKRISLEFYPDEERIIISKMLLTKTLSHKAFHYRRPLNLYMEWGTWNQDGDSNSLTATHTLYIKNLPNEVNTMLIETTNIDVLMEIRDLINTNELYYAGSQIKMW